MFSGRVLIVSDRPDVAALAERAVRSAGHVSLCVASAAEALETLQEGLIPDTLVSDAATGGVEPRAGYAVLFRDGNLVGRHLALVEDDRRAEEWAGYRGTSCVLAPFSAAALEAGVRGAMEETCRDLREMRGQVFRETARLKQIVRSTQREVVEALALAIESRDPYMQGHCKRVAALSGRVARALRVEPGAADRLRTAARLHEIGRLSVPLELQHKTEPLTPAELEQVRAHVRTGAEVLRAVSALREVAVLVEGHALEFAALPRLLPSSSPDFLLAGILRVADAYDAMATPRAYRGSLPRSYWQGVLERGAGTAFDPRAVEAFLRTLPTTAAA